MWQFDNELTVFCCYKQKQQQRIIMLNESIYSSSTVDKRTGTDVPLLVRAHPSLYLSPNKTFKHELHGLNLFQDHRTLQLSLCWSYCITVTIGNWLAMATPRHRTTQAIWQGPVNPANCKSSSAADTRPVNVVRQLLHHPSKSDKDS